VPIPLLVAVYLIIQVGALAVYVAVWIALSFLIYDELRWQGFHRLGNSTSASQPSKTSWLVSWSSLRMADWNGRTLWFASLNPQRKMSITFDRSDAPLVERSLTSWGVRYSPKSLRLPQALTRLSTLALTLTRQESSPFLVPQLPFDEYPDFVDLEIGQ